MNKKDKEDIIRKLRETTSLIEYFKSVDNVVNTKTKNDMIFRLCLHRRNLIKRYHN